MKPERPTLHLLGMLADFCMCKQCVKVRNIFYWKLWGSVDAQNNRVRICSTVSFSYVTLLFKILSAHFCYGIYRTVASWAMVTQLIATFTRHQQPLCNHIWTEFTAEKLLRQVTIKLNCINGNKCHETCSMLLHDEHLFPKQNKAKPHCPSR